MLKPISKNKFDKDLKKARKQYKDLSKIRDIMDCLVEEVPLDLKYKDHKLKGEYTDCRECHIEPDWLLIYLIEEDTITFIRTGSHAEIFK